MEIKNDYFHPKCPKIRFSYYSNKENSPFATKRVFVILFLTLNEWGEAIAGLARWKNHHLHITSYLSLLFTVFAN